jgi:hypothetical protein
LFVIVVSVVAVNILWKRYVDHASTYIFSYVDVYQKAFLQARPQKEWWEFLLPMPELNGGIWATTGVLGVYALEQLLGSPVRAYYFVTSLVVATGVLASWRVYHSRLLSGLVGLSLALSTHVYISYALSGAVIIPLVMTFAILYSYSQFELFRQRSVRWPWRLLFLVSLVLYALSYEGWLDFIVLQWIVYPVLIYLFYRRKDNGRLLTAICVLLVATLAVLLYIVVKLDASYSTLHRVGSEADTVFNYAARYWLVAVEDVMVNVITLFFTAVITFVPPQLFNFSMSSWYFGDDVIVDLQHGYHATHAQLVAYSHLFLWRFYAGITFALFCIAYGRVLRGLFSNFSPILLSFWIFMTMTIVGSPTHAMTKMRPMHVTPLLGYQVHVAIIGVVFLMCFGLYYLSTAMKSRWQFYILVVACGIDLVYCALAKPSLLSHMSVLSGLYPYPIP